MRRLLLGAAFASLLFCVECVSADARLYACDSEGRCPEGFACEADLLCHPEGDTGGGLGGGVGGGAGGGAGGGGGSAQGDAGFDGGGSDAGVDGGTDAGSCRQLGQTGCAVNADCCGSLFCHAGRCEAENDTCAYAKVFDFAFDGGTIGEAYGSTAGALNDEISCQGSGTDVFYKFSAEGSLNIQLTRLFDAGYEPIVMLQGKCGSTINTCDIQSNGTAAISQTALAPRVWHVIVDGHSTTPGPFKLTISGSRTNLETGDVCGDEQPIVLDSTVTSKQLGPYDTAQLVSAGDPANPCLSAYRDRVYRVEAKRGGMLQVSVTPNSAWDVQLALTRGSDCENATTAVSCTDVNAASGTESLSYSVPDGGGVYFLWVGGDVSTDYGSYQGLISIQ